MPTHEELRKELKRTAGVLHEEGASLHSDLTALADRLRRRHQDLSAHLTALAGQVPSDPGTPTPVPPTPTPTEPTPTPTEPTPTPTEPTPTPTPGLYAEIGGIPAGLSVLEDGRDLSKLGGPALLRPDGKYTVSGGLSVNLFCPEPKRLLIPGKSGQQIQLAKNLRLAGFGFTGFGLKKSTDGTEAGIVTDDGCQLHSMEVTKSVGVGALFKGSGLRSFDLHAHHNGTSGRMVRSRGDNKTKGSGFHEVRSHLHHNNHGGKKSDAANKATQTSDYLGDDLHVHDEADGAIWFDIACWNTILRNPRIERITTETDWYRAVGVRFELNAWGTYSSGVYGGFIGGLEGSAVASNESGNIEVVGVEIDDCKYALELRQLTRDDDPGDGGTDSSKWLTDARERLGPGRPGAPKDTPGWFVYGVTFKDNKLGDKAGPLVLSSAGNDTKKQKPPYTKNIRQSTHDIRIEGNTGKVDVRIPE